MSVSRDLMCTKSRPTPSYDLCWFKLKPKHFLILKIHLSTSRTLKSFLHKTRMTFSIMSKTQFWIWNMMKCVFLNQFCHKKSKQYFLKTIFIFSPWSLSSGDFDQLLGLPCSLRIFHPENCWQDNLLQDASGHQLQKRPKEGNCQRSFLCSLFIFLGSCSWSAWASCSCSWSDWCCSAWPSSCRISAAVPNIAMQSYTFKRIDTSLVSLGWLVGFESDTCFCCQTERDENPVKVHLGLNSCLVRPGFISCLHPVTSGDIRVLYHVYIRWPYVWEWECGSNR